MRTAASDPTQQISRRAGDPGAGAVVRVIAGYVPRLDGKA
jgi:hypothetical protein